MIIRNREPAYTSVENDVRGSGLSALFPHHYYRDVPSIIVIDLFQVLSVQPEAAQDGRKHVVGATPREDLGWRKLPLASGKKRMKFFSLSTLASYV